jgi:hypothetical protein
MIKTLLAAITATVLLASSAVPSGAQIRYRGGYGYGGGWHGGGWNGGAGAALGLGLGLGLLGGALWLRPCSSRTHHLVLVRPIPAILPICAKLPDCMAANSAMTPGWPSQGVAPARPFSIPRLCLLCQSFWLIRSGGDRPVYETPAGGLPGFQVGDLCCREMALC